MFTMPTPYLTDGQLFNDLGRLFMPVLAHGAPHDLALLAQTSPVWPLRFNPAPTRPERWSASTTLRIFTNVKYSSAQKTRSATVICTRPPIWCRLRVSPCSADLARAPAPESTRTHPPRAGVSFNIVHLSTSSATEGQLFLTIFFSLKKKYYNFQSAINCDTPTSEIVLRFAPYQARINAVRRVPRTVSSLNRNCGSYKRQKFINSTRLTLHFVALWIASLHGGRTEFKHYSKHPAINYMKKNKKTTTEQQNIDLLILII